MIWPQIVISQVEPQSKYPEASITKLNKKTKDSCHNILDSFSEDQNISKFTLKSGRSQNALSRILKSKADKSKVYKEEN